MDDIWSSSASGMPCQPSKQVECEVQYHLESHVNYNVQENGICRWTTIIDWKQVECEAHCYSCTERKLTKKMSDPWSPKASWMWTSKAMQTSNEPECEVEREFKSQKDLNIEASWYMSWLWTQITKEVEFKFKSKMTLKCEVEWQLIIHSKVNPKFSVIASFKARWLSHWMLFKLNSKFSKVGPTTRILEI